MALCCVVYVGTLAFLTLGDGGATGLEEKSPVAVQAAGERDTRRPPGQTSEGITGPTARADPAGPAGPGRRHRRAQLAGLAGGPVPPLEPDQRPRQDPRPPAHGQPAPGRGVAGVRARPVRPQPRPAHHAAGPRRRRRRHQRRLLRHLRHRRTARGRPRPAAGHAARREVHLAQRVLRDPRRGVPDRAPDADRPDRAVPADRDHQRELAAGPGREGRHLRPRLGPDLRLPDHRRTAEAGPDGRDPGRAGGLEPDHPQQRPPDQRPGADRTRPGGRRPEPAAGRLHRRRGVGAARRAADGDQWREDPAPRAACPR